MVRPEALFARRAWLGLGCAAAALAVASPAVAQDGAQPPAASRLFPLTVPVLDIDRPVGTISARVSQTGDYRIPVASLLPLLQPLYSVSEFSVISGRLQGVQEIGPDDVARLRLPLRFDAQRVALVIAVPANARGSTDLELSSLGRAPEPSASRQNPAGFSGYLNVNFGFVEDPTLGIGKTRGTFLLESGLRLGGFVLENSATVEIGGAPDRTFSRQATRLTYDIPSANIRLAAGDLFTPTVGFLGSVDMLGISAFRNVTVFDPFQNSRPTGRGSFILAEPSDVNIYVNGALIRQVRLQPGNYNLSNFPLVSGANDVRVEVRNDRGQAQTFTFSSFFDADLLAPGIAQWEVDAGVQATRFNQQVSYDFGDLVVAGFYRRGVSETLTLGANARYVNRQAIVGAEAVTATPIANISFDLAASRGSRRTGVAAAVTVQPQLPDSWRGRGRTLDGFVEYSSRNFGDNAVTGFGQGFRAGIRYSDVLIANRLTFSASAAYSRVYGPGNDGWDASVSLAYRFNYDFILRVTPEYRNTIAGESPFSVFVSLTKRFGRTSRADASYDSRDNRYLAEYDYRSQYGGIGTFGANLTVSGADGQQNLADGTLEYIGNRFEVSGGYAQVLNDGRAGDLGRVRFNVGTAIAFADGVFAIGRPVRDSFAIVRAHPTLGDRQVIVGPHVEGQGDRARTGALGAALLSDLGSYSLSRVLYDVANLPAGYDLGTGSFEFFPPYRSGYSAVVGSNRLASAIGIAADAAGQPLALAVGTVTSVNDSGFADQQVFTNRSGRFGIIGLAPGKTYEVRFPAAGVRIRIVIPADATGFVNVGTLSGTGGQ